MLSQFGDCVLTLLTGQNSHSQKNMPFYQQVIRKSASISPVSSFYIRSLLSQPDMSRNRNVPITWLFCVSKSSLEYVGQEAIFFSLIVMNIHDWNVETKYTLAGVCTQHESVSNLSFFLYCLRFKKKNTNGERWQKSRNAYILLISLERTCPNLWGSYVNYHSFRDSTLKC